MCRVVTGTRRIRSKVKKATFNLGKPERELATNAVNTESLSKTLIADNQDRYNPLDETPLQLSGSVQLSFIAHRFATKR